MCFAVAVLRSLVAMVDGDYDIPIGLIVIYQDVA